MEAVMFMLILNPPYQRARRDHTLCANLEVALAPKVPNIGWHDVANAYSIFRSDSLIDNSTFSLGLLYAITQSERPQRIVEIGTQSGTSTAVFCHSVNSWGGEVLSIDIDDVEGTVRSTLRKKGIKDSNWKFIRGSSQNVNPPDEIDLLYVDGEHSYSGVALDMARYGLKVRTGGIIILDDYFHGFPGKVLWINERYKDLQPIIIGPHILIRKQEKHNEIFCRSPRLSIKDYCGRSIMTDGEKIYQVVSEEDVDKSLFRDIPIMYVLNIPDELGSEWDRLGWT